MLRLLTDADDLARYALAFLSLEDVKSLSSVSRSLARSPLRLSLATRGVWRLPYPSQWKASATTTIAPPPAQLPPLDWQVYLRSTYLHRMDPAFKNRLRCVAVPRSAMLRTVVTQLPGVTAIHSWQFDGDVAQIKELSPLERRRVYRMQREIDLCDLAGDDTTVSSSCELDTLALPNASIANLHCIRSLRGLTALDLSRADVDREQSNFKWLASLPQLQSLNLDRTGLSELAFLRSLPQLHTLRIAGASIASFVGLDAVAATLTSLDVSNVWLENERVDFTPFQQLRHLRAELLGAMSPLDVQLDAPSLQSCSFRYCWLLHREFLTCCPRLIELDLREIILFEPPATPQRLPHIKTLQLSSNPAAIRCYEWSQMPQLDTLQLRKWDPAFVSGDLIDGTFLGSLSNLHTLEIAKLSKYSALPLASPLVVALTIHQVKASNVDAIAQLLATNHQLETLCLSAERAVQLALPPLAAPARLRELQLANITLTNLDTLALCGGLRSLEISGFGTVPDATPLDHLLPHCQRLRALTICQNTAFHSVSSLSILPHLQVLSVRHTGVSDVSPLATMHALQELDVGYTHVVDLSPLRGLARLRRVVLPTAAGGCELFHDADAFPMLRHVVHEHVNGARDCLLTGHDAILAA